MTDRIEKHFLVKVPSYEAIYNPVVKVEINHILEDTQCMNNVLMTQELKRCAGTVSISYRYRRKFSINLICYGIEQRSAQECKDKHFKQLSQKTKQ